MSDLMVENPSQDISPEMPWDPGGLVRNHIGGKAFVTCPHVHRGSRELVTDQIWSLVLKYLGILGV